MHIAVLPENEKTRIKKLNFYQILDTPSEDAFDRITRIVSETIGVPIALVSLVDRDRQWFKSKCGLSANQTPRDIAFCAHAILQKDLFIVADATKDDRFFDNPLVVNGPKIRFYAGAALTTPDGLNLGTLCAIDTKPRKLNEKKKRLLADLAKVVVDELELRIALKNAEDLVEEKEKQKKLKDEFVSTISHELRTPLTSISGSLGLIAGGAVGQLRSEVQDLVIIAHRNSRRLSHLINDLLDIEKLAAGKMHLDMQLQKILPLVEQSLKENETYGVERRVKLRMTDSESSLKARFDTTRLMQVLMNLISNAVKYSPEDGTVRVSLQAKDSHARVTVTDDGPGVPAEFRSRVFEKFSQADSSDTRKKGGSGLGLAISKELIEHMGGRIGFDSTEGKGASFFIELPIGT